MKKIIITLKILMTNWVNYLGLSLLIYLAYYCFYFFGGDFSTFSKSPEENILLILLLLPAYTLIPFTFGYLFFQFLIDSILLFVFKFSIKKTIKIENYIFILILIVILFFTLLIHYLETKIDFYEGIKLSLSGVIILILCSSVFIYTQKRRIKKIEKILEVKPVANNLYN